MKPSRRYAEVYWIRPIITLNPIPHKLPECDPVVFVLVIEIYVHF